jgi:hypothetical protein
VAKLEFNKILPIAIGAVSAAVIAGLTFAWFESSKTQHLALAAGSKSGESYILSRNPRAKLLTLGQFTG